MPGYALSCRFPKIDILLEFVDEVMVGCVRGVLFGRGCVLIVRVQHLNGLDRGIRTAYVIDASKPVRRLSLFTRL